MTQQSLICHACQVHAKMVWTVFYLVLLMEVMVLRGDGAQFTTSVLEELPSILTNSGAVFFAFSSIGNIARVESTLDAHYSWSVISRTWIPLRFFEIERRSIIDALVENSQAYYRIENGHPFAECIVYSAFSR